MRPSTNRFLWCLFFTLGCQTATQNETEAARRVEVAEVRTERYAPSLRLLGEVHSDHEVRVTPQLAERIRNLYVTEGQTVRRGDPIAALDGDVLNNSVAQALATRQAAESNRDQLAQDIVRVARLVEQGAAARTQLETIQAQMRSADAQVAQLSAIERSAGSQRLRAIIRSPIDGTVALLTAQEGALAVPQIPLCSVVDLAHQYVRVSVIERDYPRVVIGQQAMVRLIADESVEIRGTVRLISPVLDPLTRTALIEIALVGDIGRFRPGMTAEVKLELGTATDAVVVPASALILNAGSETNQQAIAFVNESGIARRRLVELGDRIDDVAIVRTGLAAGESLVVAGQTFLRDGQRIEVSTPNATAAPTEQAAD